MIVMYSTGCPRCKILHNKLSKLNETFTVIEGEEEIEAKGFTSAPILEVNGVIMDYGAAIKWVNKLINEHNEVSHCDSCNI